MSEMVERVTRAICKRVFGDPNVYGDTCCCQAGGTSGCFSFECRDEARTAIEAMREPTEDMVNRTDDLDIYWSYSADGRPGGPKDVWQVMIDAALKEGP